MYYSTTHMACSLIDSGLLSTTWSSAMKFPCTTKPLCAPEGGQAAKATSDITGLWRPQHCRVRSGQRSEQWCREEYNINCCLNYHRKALQRKHWGSWRRNERAPNFPPPCFSHHMMNGERLLMELKDPNLASITEICSR